MKRDYINRLILLTMFVAFLACDKEEKLAFPSVDTASVDEIYNTTARVGGRVSNNGGAEIIDRGVYWGSSANPEKSGTKLSIGSGDGAYYETLSGLTSGVKYYVKAYAANNMGTSYGDETFFTTQINLPTVETTPVTIFSSTTADVGGNVTDDGGFQISKRGIYWGTDPNPRLSGTKLDLGSGDGAFSVTVTDLSRSYTYYIMAYATNIKGTAYGEEIIFSTEPELATVYTKMISGISPYSAVVGGTISSNGGTMIIESGVFWGKSADPVSTGTKLINVSGTVDFTNTIDNLDPGVKYFVTAYAINSIGTSYGEGKSFTTLGKAPEVRMLDYSNLTNSGITLNGVVSASELNTTVTFQYIIDTDIDTTSIVAGSPVTENDDTITLNISGLNSLTTYHFRIKAENELGAVYSEILTVKTVITGIPGTVTDYEGNVYNTIGIGYQEWMTENLRAIKYNNGTPVPFINNDSIWSQLKDDGFCWYGKDSTSNYNTYGALYNWYAVNSGQLCPTGWHVPTTEDITQLVDYTGGAGGAGGFLKESGTSHWNSPNTGATNKYGFTARAGGKRLSDGNFDFVKVEGNWWSSTEYSTLNGSNLSMLFNYSNSFQAYSNKKIGMSVRCIKN